VVLLQEYEGKGAASGTLKDEGYTYFITGSGERKATAVVCSPRVVQYVHDVHRGLCGSTRVDLLLPTGPMSLVASHWPADSNLESYLVNTFQTSLCVV
jgi:hypothetical protein